jgi:hypothetical protein
MVETDLSTQICGWRSLSRVADSPFTDHLLKVKAKGPTIQTYLASATGVDLFDPFHASDDDFSVIMTGFKPGVAWLTSDGHWE